MNLDQAEYEKKTLYKTKGSFYIYLPKDWAQKFDLMNETHLFMKRVDAQSLLFSVTPFEMKLDPSAQITIDLDKIEEISQKKMKENFINAYTMGYKSILFKKKTKISLSIVKRIQQFTRQFIGIKIFQESEGEILLKEEPNQIQIQTLFQQMRVKIGLVLNYLIELLNLNGTSTIAELFEEIHQIKMYRYAIDRYTHRILHTPGLHLSNAMNINEYMTNFQITKVLDQIGDKIEEILTTYSIHQISNKWLISIYITELYKIATELRDKFENRNFSDPEELILKITEYKDASYHAINENIKDNAYLTRIGEIFQFFIEIFTMTQKLAWISEKTYQEQLENLPIPRLLLG
jgi:hypothetical protein